MQPNNIRYKKTLNKYRIVNKLTFLPPDAVRCQELHSSELLRFIGRIVRLLHIPLSFDASNEGDSLELSGSYLIGKNRMAGLQSGEGRTMIDSVVWVQYTNVTDTHAPALF